MDKLQPRTVRLTTRSGVDIRRSLPHRKIRMIGAWCFLDHYGPTPQVDAMNVAAHPHTGLQTVSWLYSGEIEHCDSLGSWQRIRPGELNIMTSGHGIAHSERSIAESGDLHGVQLWVVLPNEHRDHEPMFRHHADLPAIDVGGIRGRLILGEFAGVRSGVEVFSDLVGVELRPESGAKYEVPLREDFEYGFHVASGQAMVGAELVEPGDLLYLPPGRSDIEIETGEDSIVLMIGGRPFDEEVIMWWNFIGRTQDEIEQMRSEWNAGADRFPSFTDNIGGRIPAPELPTVALVPRGGRRRVS